PFTAQASASERIVLLVELVITLPALRSQINCSSGIPSTSGNNGFKRGSMQLKATSGNSDSNSAVCNPALPSPATAAWFASIIASNNLLGSFVMFARSGSYASRSPRTTNQKINDRSQERQKNNQQHPNNSFAVGEALVANRMDEHPQPNREQ